VLKNWTMFFMSFIDEILYLESLRVRASDG